MRITGSKYDLYHKFVKILSNHQKQGIWAKLESRKVGKLESLKVRRFVGSQVPGLRAHRFAGSGCFKSLSVAFIHPPTLRLDDEHDYEHDCELRLRITITSYDYEQQSPTIRSHSPIHPFTHSPLSPISYLLSLLSPSLLTSSPCSGIVPTLVLLGGRPMVGLRTLDPPIGVRIPASQPLFQRPPASPPAAFNF